MSFLSRKLMMPSEGGGILVDDVFSTDLYTGNGSTQTINNGIDLAGDGGLVWVKKRSGSQSHMLADTESGIQKYLTSNATSQQVDGAGSRISNANSDGFSIGADSDVNENTFTYAAWTFRKSPRFFDVVTYTGDGTQDRQIPHDLGVAPGAVIVKRRNASENWPFWHRKGDFNPTEHRHGFLNLNSDFNNYGDFSNSIDQSALFTDSIFTVRNDINISGQTYVAYLFAHDPAPNGVIQCGSYTGNGSTTGPVINLGWEPQWVLVKASSISNPWYILDNKRLASGSPTYSVPLSPNSSNAETTTGLVEMQSNGFQIVNSGTGVNGSGNTYIYVAIRAEEA